MRSSSATLAVVPLLAAAAAGSDQFETPQQLTQGGDPFELMFPTPVLEDLDGDGQRELVVGDLRGHLYACSAETVTVSWTKMEHFKSEGKTLRLNNW